MLTKLNSIWSSVHSNLPKNIFNFTVRYINDTLPTRKNLSKWGLATSSDCHFCLKPESLLHVVAGCNNYLNEGRYTWRHDSVFHLIALSLQGVTGTTLYADLPGFISPSVITGDNLRPDLLLTFKNTCLYILELTVGFETNLSIKAARKTDKYQDLTVNPRQQYYDVKLTSLSISTLGIISSFSTAFIDMFKEIKVENVHQEYIFKKISAITIRCTYFIFGR